jgi:hypothetical protein
MAIYKVSYVVKGSKHPGGIINLKKKPVEGDQLQIGELVFDILEIVELMPPRGDFFYIHATCKISNRNEKAEE